MNPTPEQIQGYIKFHEKYRDKTRDPLTYEFHCQRIDFWESKK